MQCEQLFCTGKNRPLDEDEVEFVDALEAAQRGKEQAERRQELDALEAYQLVRIFLFFFLALSMAQDISK